MARNYSTAEALAQFALELDAQRQEAREDTQGGAGATVQQVEPVFSRATRDAIVIEAARVLVTDGLNIRGE